jgi:hypothetical protein
MKKSFLVSVLGFLFCFAPMVIQAQEMTLMLGPPDFVPQTNEGYFMFRNQLFPYTGTVYRTFFAPVHLPNNVRIKRVVIYYKDEHATSNIFVTLYRCNTYTLDSNILCDWNSSGTTSGWQQHTAYANWSFNEVQNGGYHYVFRINFNSDSTNEVMLYAIKIIYQ